MISCSDKEKYEDLYLVMDGFWLQILAKDYIMQDGSLCFLGFILNDQEDDYWVLGDVFLQGYYSIHDNSDPLNAKLGLVPHKNSSKDFVQTGSVPNIEAAQVAWEQCWLFDVYWATHISWFIDFKFIYQPICEILLYIFPI